MADPFKDYLTVSQIAKKFNLSRARIHQLITQYSIEYERMPSGEFMIHRQQYEKINPKNRQ